MCVCARARICACTGYRRQSAGSSALSGLCGQASLATRTRRLTPLALGDEDQIDEDVAREVQRVAGGDADSDVVKVSTRFVTQYLLLCGVHEVKRWV